MLLIVTGSPTRRLAKLAFATSLSSNRRSYDTALHRQRHKVENLFAKLKDWRRIATRNERRAHAFFSVICIAAAVIFWL